MESLTDVFDFFDEITFISYFTVYPIEEDISTYLNNFSELLLKKKNSNLFLLGTQLAHYGDKKLPKGYYNL